MVQIGPYQPYVEEIDVDPEMWQFLQYGNFQSEA